MQRTDWIEAGGLVGDVADPARVDRVDARAWRHPGIPDRVVVRLVPAGIAGGDEAEARLHGFVPAGVVEGLGVQVRRSLGFPGWVLVNDPGRARMALDTWKEMREHRKRLVVKPGAARDLLAEIAARLNRAAPHFLPTFWEEIGRWFADAGNPTFAASAFERAREAELAHGLAVDEDRRTAVFLEFALMGALTVKSMTAYGKELQRTLGKEAAADRFLELVTRRTQGGLPPWANVLKDLAGMATAAKRDPVALQRRFLADVLGSPAMARAPAKVWTTVLALLDAPTDEEKAALARAWPANLEDGDAWIPWLVARGCLEHVDDPARWFTRAVVFAAAEGVSPSTLVPVLEQLADRIRAAGTPLQLREDEYGEVDVAILDRALSLGLPVGHDATVDVGIEGWLDAAVEGAASSLDAVLADPRFAPALDRAVAARSADSRFDAAADSCPPIAALRRRWLEGRISTIPGGSVRAAAEAIEELAGSTTPATWARFPDVEAALDAADIAGALARSLRWGLAAELAWPEVEAAVAELGAAKGARVRARISFPWIILDDGRNLLAVGPDGQRIAHELHVPKGGEVEGIAVVGDTLLVALRTEDYEQQAYWSTSARKRFELHEDIDDRPALPLAGRWTFGGRAFAPGDEEIETRTAFGDGTSVWAYDDDSQLRRLEPDGSLGPVELPPALAGGTAANDLVLLGLPRPSPLGGADGVYASVRSFDELRINDGRVVRQLPGTEPPIALLALPGAEPLRLTTEWSYHQDAVGGGNVPFATSPDGAWPLGAVTDDTWGGGMPVRLALDAWHLAVPRDPAGSAALRRIGRDDVAALLTVPDDELDAAVGRAIPEITAPVLRAAVVALAGEARAARAALAELKVEAKEEVVEIRLGEPGDTEIGDAMDGLEDDVWSSEHVLSAIRAAGRFLLAGEDAAYVDSELPWPRWLDALPAVAWRAVAPADEDDETREHLLALLDAYREAGFTAGNGRLRVATWKTETLEHPFLRTTRDDGELILETPGWTATADGSRYWVRTVDDWDDGATLQVLEWRADGDFRTPDGVTVEDEVAPVPWSDAALGAFLAAAREQPEIPIVPELARMADAMGVSRALAAIAASGFRKLAGGVGAADRKRWGLKATEAKVATEDAGRIELPARRALLTAAMPADPARLWEPGVAADGLISAWTAAFERVEPLSDDLVQRLGRELGHLGSRASDLVEILRRGERAPQLLVSFDADLVADLPTLLVWAHASTPGGDPVRARLPGILAAARARLDDPATSFGAGYWWEYEGSTLEAWWRDIGGEPWREDATDEDEGEPVVVRSGGLLVRRSGANELELEILPAALQPGDAERAASYASLANERDLVPLLAMLRSPGIAAAIAEPVPDGAWPQDPRVTNPELVRTVANARGWTAETATIWLQLLALGAPTKKDLQRWNGWKPKQIEAAVAPLVADGSLLVGKRARAGREWFLPGPWVELGTPLPMEGWKLPLFGATGPDSLLPLRVPLPAGPYRDLFAAAWARVESGDVPRYG